jgi:hypothetical protein
MITRNELKETPIPSPKHQMSYIYRHQLTYTIFARINLLETPMSLTKHQLCNDPPRYDDKPLITSAIFFFFVCVCTRVTRHYTLRRHMTTNHDAYNCDINIKDLRRTSTSASNEQQSTDKIIRLTTRPSYPAMVRTSKTHKQRSSPGSHRF